MNWFNNLILILESICKLIYLSFSRDLNQFVNQFVENAITLGSFVFKKFLRVPQFE